uniref:Uncharacterized protein n=1 Tax=Knipowitschia caucasica TaxID=637954 RepID=A0AAV2KRB1_KNICA
MMGGHLSVRTLQQDGLPDRMLSNSSSSTHLSSSLVPSAPEPSSRHFEELLAPMFARNILSRSICTQRLGKNVTLYVNHVAPHSSPTTVSVPASAPVGEEPRPLLLMLPWLGSRPQAVAKYCDIYFRTGLDVLVVTSEGRCPAER